jgi:hypothetical protein
MAVLSCLLLTSCVTDSVNPLSSPDKSRADERLVGDWRDGTDSDRSTCHITITKAPWMHVDIIPDPHSSQANDVPESYDFFPSVIGKDTFLNIVSVGKDDKGAPTKTYQFFRYTVSDDHVLKVWGMSNKLTAAAVRAGKLKGLLKPSGYTVDQPPRPDFDVTLQDTSANIATFIQGSNIDALFGGKATSYDRVKPAGN